MSRAIGRVDKNQFPLIWRDVSRHLLAYGREWLEIECLDDVGARLLLGHLDLWVMTDDAELEAVGICAWDRKPKRSYYHVCWVGGENVLQFLQEGLELVEKYACMNGASEIRLGGRAGWMRKLEAHGYRAVVELRKPVDVLWRS